MSDYEAPTCSFCGREVRDNDRIEELEAENARLLEALLNVIARLRELVEKAYIEGYGHAAIERGETNVDRAFTRTVENWSDSGSRAALQETDK